MDPVACYLECGFAIVRSFGDAEVCRIDEFARTAVYRVLARWTGGREASFPLETYHLWSKTLSVDHEGAFRAENRHLSPGPEVSDLLVNATVRDFLRDLGVRRFRLWDEGLGWLGFRFIRPGAGDGYSMTRKAWGFATNVISCWVPVIGHSPRETLTLVPGSHKKEYPRYLPADGKFRRDEYRLAGGLNGLDLYNPALQRGEVLFYHPLTLHSEDVVSSPITRLNLEYRVEPL